MEIGSRPIVRLVCLNRVFIFPIKAAEKTSDVRIHIARGTTESSVDYLCRLQGWYDSRVWHASLLNASRILAYV